MSPQIKEALALLCYAVVAGVVGAIALAIAAANEPEPGSLSSSPGSDIARAAGGGSLLIAVLLLIVGLLRLAKALGQSDSVRD